MASSTTSPRVLLLSLVFSPDGVSTSVIMTELAQELKALGHDITVLTTTPHYNEEPEGRARQVLRPGFGGLIYTSELDGIRIYHARVPSKGRRVISRLFEYGWFHLASTLLGGTVARDFDIVLAPSPPLTIGVNAWMLARMRGVPFVYNVQEIYPDVAVQLGVLRNRRLVSALTRLERFIYDRSSRVVVISEHFRRRLLAKGVPEEKLEVIPNFVDADFIHPRPQDNAFSRAHGLAGKFVVCYAGNLGLTQDFESLLSAAERLVGFPEVRFLIVGGGARRAWLEEELAARRLENVTLLDYQPRSVVPDIYATSGVCVIPMKPGTTQDTFPSKVYTIMAAGRPVIAAADADSELAAVVETARCGDVIEPGDVDGLVDAIRRAYEAREESAARGERGRRFVEQNHTRGVVARKYDRLIRDLIAGDERRRGA